MDDPTTTEGSAVSLTPDEPEEKMTSPRDHASALVGQVISQRYRVDELIAVGGMGTVYRGTHLFMHKRVAIKVLHKGMEDLTELVKRFEREAIAGAHIHHPNVASATDFGQFDDGGFFLILEYVKGRTLHDEIKNGALTVARAAHIARQIASALEATHATGVVHRDVKPRNVMLVDGQYDVAKLIDFGFAKVHRERLSTLELIEGKDASRITKVGTVFGTIAYLAPEASLGMDAVDTRADLYALGVIFFEMLCARRPFESTEPAVLFKMHRDAPVPPINDYAKEPVPPAIEAVIKKLLAKDPKDRYQSAFEVIDALDLAVETANVAEVPAMPLAGGHRPRGARMPSQHPVVSPTPSTTNERATRILDGAPSSRSSPPPRIVVATPAPSRKSRSPLVASAIALALVATAVTWALRRRSEAAQMNADAAAAMASAAAARASDAAKTRAALATPKEPTTTVAATTAAATAPVATTSATAPSTEAEARTALRNAVKAHAWSSAEDIILKLVDADPSAFKDKEVVAYTTATVTALEREGEGNGSKVLSVLATKLGADGIDALYDIVQSRGGTRAANHAAELLRQPQVLARGTPAARIAFELRDASCDKKLTLLDRAVAEGDVRALVVLETLGSACFKHNKQIPEAEHAIRQRLGPSASN